MSALFCVSFVFHVLLFNQQLHPQKLTCPLKRDYFNRKYIFQPLILSRLSLVFWGEKFSVPNTSPRSCWQLWWHVRALPPRGPCVPGWSSDCRSASPGRIHRALQYPKNFCAFHKKLRWIWYMYIYTYNSLHIQYIYMIYRKIGSNFTPQIKTFILNWIPCKISEWLWGWHHQVHHYFTFLHPRPDPIWSRRNSSQAVALRSAAAPSLPAIGPSLPGRRLSSWLPPTL